MNEPAPRLAVNKTDAALSLGVSVDFFDRHLAPELRGVRRGRRVMYPVKELERWLDRSAQRVVGGHQALSAALVPHLVWLQHLGHPHVHAVVQATRLLLA